MLTHPPHDKSSENKRLGPSGEDGERSEGESPSKRPALTPKNRGAHARRAASAAAQIRLMPPNERLHLAQTIIARGIVRALEADHERAA